MIRRVVCAFKGHDEVAVSPGGAGMFVMPTVGLVCQYVEDEHGEFSACRRCRRVLPAAASSTQKGNQ